MGSNSFDRTMLARNSILVIALVVGGCHGCSIDCGDKKLCTDNIYGYYDSHCTGFLACTNHTQPCAGVCPHNLPILSSDGLSCTACTESGLCPNCSDGEVWCGVEEKCKDSAALCGGICSSILRPVLDPVAGECYPCAETDRWCEEEGRCYNPVSEPCNGECRQWDTTKYCSQTQLCVDEDTPCNNTNTNAQLTEEELATPEQPEEEKGLLTVLWEFITHVTQKIF